MRILAVLLASIMASAHADMDAASQDGLKQTQGLLNNPSARQKVIDKDPKAKDTDQKVQALAGSSKNKEEIYSLASQVLEKVASEANGDPAKMQALMLEAQKDPQAFFKKYFNADQQAKVRDLAGKIENDKPTVKGK